MGADFALQLRRILIKCLLSRFDVCLAFFLIFRGNLHLEYGRLLLAACNQDCRSRVSVRVLLGSGKLLCIELNQVLNLGCLNLATCSLQRCCQSAVGSEGLISRHQIAQHSVIGVVGIDIEA